MKNLERNFLEAYYKAACTSQPGDWLKAALMAKQMYNETRPVEDDPEESLIYDAAKAAWEH